MSDPTPHPFKGRTGLDRIAHATLNSLRGLRHAVLAESAFRQELVLAALLIPLAAWLPFSSLERIALVASVVLVLIVELLNSAIEVAVDRISFDTHPLSGQAKDLASAAVLLSLLLCAATWIAIAGPVVLGLLRYVPD